MAIHQCQVTQNLDNQESRATAITSTIYMCISENTHFKMFVVCMCIVQWDRFVRSELWNPFRKYDCRVNRYFPRYLSQEMEEYYNIFSFVKHFQRGIKWKIGALKAKEMLFSLRRSRISASNMLTAGNYVKLYQVKQHQ